MDDVLRKLQLTQLEMLKLVDQMCRKSDIKYSLFAGTLLGAVRHKGYIPWDDDLDICMAREEYNRFIHIWQQAPPKGYLLQNKENSPGFTQTFTKIRKEHTTFLETENEIGRYHNGIFIDVFPVDRIPSGRFARYLFFWRCLLYQLFTREYVPKKNGHLMQYGSRVLLFLTSIPQRAHIRERLLTKITSYNNNQSFNTTTIETFESIKHSYPPDMMEHFTNLPFEDSSFMCCASWEQQLQEHFGDYMQFPPKEEQTWAHHPLILDFERDYEELKGI